MSTSQRHEGGYRPDSFSKKLNVRQGEADAMVVEMAQWSRLRKRVDDLEKRWSINWLAAGASATAGLAGAALIAVLTIPQPERSVNGKTVGTGIGPAVHPVLWVILAVAVLGTVALIYLARLARGERKITGSDIVNEMDTIELAWKQRETDSSEAWTFRSP
jgi:hypothetical protein